MERLNTILADVISANGSDQRIDAEVMCLLAAPKESFIEQSPINMVWCIYDGYDRNSRPRLWDQKGWFRQDGWKITESVDAALDLKSRLIPDWKDTITSHGYNEGIYMGSPACYLYHPASSGGKTIQAFGVTRALSIVQAILLAKIEGHF